jgi:flagellin-specific chaperone FliS
MPKLNRIRIANVSYDGKYIFDQMLDTYSGENTLLNLANGSGKSVLVQMMLQPILPCSRIHNRRIEDYLSKTSAPTYIMLEWILDRTAKPQYFLTGIAMCSIGQGEDARPMAKYFTFTHKYDIATDYDIAHTPLIQQTSTGYQYMNYDEAFKLMGSVKDELRPLKRFAKDKAKDYDDELKHHRIHKEEWELLQRINDKEGGVDELFADCKTSDTVLNKWVLKTITDKIGQGNQDLREMFYALIMSVISEEETIVQRETLTAFLADSDKLLKRLTDLCSSLDDIGNIEKLLSGLYTFLAARMEKIEEESQNCHDDEEKLKQDEQHIRYEQLSEPCHIADKEYSIYKEKPFV